MLEKQFDWFHFRVAIMISIPLQADSDGFLKESQVFPGLWLDAKALVSGDIRRVFEILRQGTESPEHEAFVRELKRRGKGV